MALKLKNRLQDLYRKVTGVPKSELKTQSQMIREDFTKKPGTGYLGKSALLHAYNLKNNLFRPKGGKKIHAALDSVAPLLESGLVWSPDTRWAEEVIEECAKFPAGEHDDFVDTVTQALRRFREGGFITHPEDEVYEYDGPGRSNVYYG